MGLATAAIVVSITSLTTALSEAMGLLAPPRLRTDPNTTVSEEMCVKSGSPVALRFVSCLFFQLTKADPESSARNGRPADTSERSVGQQPSSLHEQGENPPSRVVRDVARQMRTTWRGKSSGEAES